MSMPSNGDYYIVNRDTPPDGTPLAITFNGQGAILTLTTRGSLPAQQVWNIRGADDGKTQIITPKNTSNLRPNYGGSDSTLVGGSGTSAWAIRGYDGIYTIQNGERTVTWFIKQADLNQGLIYGTGIGDVKQNWRLVPA